MAFLRRVSILPVVSRLFTPVSIFASQHYLSRYFSVKITVSGTIERILYENKENLYKVCSVKVTHVPVEIKDSNMKEAEKNEIARNMVTVAGEMLVSVGNFVECTGKWVRNSKYGHQLKVASFDPSPPRSVEASVAFLSSKLFKGIGKVRASKLVEKFGTKVFEVLESNPNELLTVGGMTKSIIENLKTEYRASRRKMELYSILLNNDIPASMAVKLWDKFGDAIFNIIQNDPYSLAFEGIGIGFIKADKIALAAGLSNDSMKRLKSALRYALMDASENGNCYVTHSALISEAVSLTKKDTFVADPLLVFNALKELGTDDLCCIVLPDSCDKLCKSDIEAIQFNEKYFVYDKRLFDMENKVSELLVNLATHPQEIKKTVDISLFISDFENREKIKLSEEQIRALHAAVGSTGFNVIIGGPGTGKTKVVKAIVELWKYCEISSESILLCSPTGRGSSNLSKMANHEARTIHRALGWYSYGNESDILNDSNKGSFAYDSKHQFPASAIIVDEVSMLNLPLTYYLLRAIKPGTRVIFMGDPNQLLAIGPGSILKDITDDSVQSIISKVVFSTLYRQSLDSQINVQAHRLINGKELEIEALPLNAVLGLEKEDPSTLVKSDLLLLEPIHNKKFASKPDYIKPLNYVLNKLLPSLGYDIRNDVQVLAPVKSGITGTNNLNSVLQGWINPKSAVVLTSQEPSDNELPDESLLSGIGSKEESLTKTVYRLNDRVMQIKNNYDKWVYNGDIGFVVPTEADHNHSSLCVQYSKSSFFNEEFLRCNYEDKDMNELNLAYAITVHKAQGSEFPVVVSVFPNTTGPFDMVTKRLLYTALTRAKKLAIIISTRNYLKFIESKPSLAPRKTKLTSRLLQTFKKINETKESL